MIILDYQDRRPIYEQVVERFQTLILSGAIPPGERLPSVRQLAMDLSINPNTIQRAYMELEQQRLIYPVKGKGNFVADSSGIREAGRETFRKEIRELIKKGRQTGISENEVRSMVHACYQEEGI
jgi:GntR family transcriptional regulator